MNFDSTFRYNGYTELQLRRCFNKVKHKDNWKMPIWKKVRCSTKVRDCIITSIRFYAGGCAEWVDAGDGVFLITAPEYYELIGS